MLEELFNVTRYLKNISWSEAYGMPLEYRRWLIERERKQREKEAEEAKKARGRKGK
jgi:hypothetical protein